MAKKKPIKEPSFLEWFNQEWTGGCYLWRSIKTFLLRNRRKDNAWIWDHADPGWRVHAIARAGVGAHDAHSALKRQLTNFVPTTKEQKLARATLLKSIPQPRIVLARRGNKIVASWK